MKRLILIRHAKSSWEEPFGADHDRVLNARGRHACELVGAWFLEQKLAPDHIICSTAERCVETCARLSGAANWSAKPEFKKSIYHASPDHLMTQINGASGDCLAVFGHNPGIGALAEQLVKGRLPDHPKFLQYPTAAVTVLEFDIDDWAYAQTGEGKLANFIVPKDLDA